MPNAGPGRVLRALRGGVGRRFIGPDENILVATLPAEGESGNLTFVGTPAHLACTGLLPAFLTSSARLAGAELEDSYRVFLPTPAWGSAGSVIRTPRCVVLVCPDMLTDRSPAGDLPEINFQTAFADAIDGLASQLTDHGISVIVVKNWYGLWPGGRANPLLGPCVCPAGEEYVNNHGGDPNSNIYFGVDYTTDERVTGGDVYWAFVGGAYYFDIAGYTGAYIKVEVNSTPTVSLPTGTIAWSNVGSSSVSSPDPPFDVFSSVVQQFIMAAELQMDVAKLLPTARRCRKFAFRFVSTDEPYEIDAGGGSVVLTGPDSTLLNLFPSELDVDVLRGSGSGVATTVINDAKDFFGLT